MQRKKDKKNIWIDLNNNGIKDRNEKINKFTNFSKIPNLENFSFYNNHQYEHNYFIDIDMKKLRIYGNITGLKYKVTIINAYNDKFEIGFENIYISKLKDLKNLLFIDYELLNLDISENKKLERLIIRASNLKNINVSKNTELETLFVSNKNLTILNISKNKNLKELALISSKLSSLNISKNKRLKYLSLEGLNKLNSLNVFKNKKLEP